MIPVRHHHPHSGPSRPRRRRRAFTLVEVMVSVTILALLMVLITSSIGRVQSIWVDTRARAEQFQEARAAFETMARRLGQATLDSYWAYQITNGRPTLYIRDSDLHFVAGPAADIVSAVDAGPGQAVFFQSTFGFAGSKTGGAANQPTDRLDDLLNAWGYYVTYNSDLDDRPDFLRQDLGRHPERRRFRLMEFRQPSEDFRLFSSQLNLRHASTPGQAHAWFNGPFPGGHSHADHTTPLADNILAVFVTPRAPDNLIGNNIAWDPAPDYRYDTRAHQWQGLNSQTAKSRHQLPPVLDLTLIAVQERSWERFEDARGETGARSFVDNLFNGRFANADDFQDDLDEVEQQLLDSGLQHRVFTTAVPLRASKWITEQEGAQ